MERLTQRDLSALLEFLQSNYAARDLPDFRAHVITALPRLVRSEVTGYNEVDTQKWQDEYIVSPLERLDFPDSFQLFNQHIHEHPIINRLAQTQEPVVLKFSDLVTHRQFSRTGLYHEFFRRLGTRDQIAVTLRIGKRALVGIALNRYRDYTERERLLLTTVRPHLVQAYENACAISRMKEDLQIAHRSLEQVNAMVIPLRAGGRAVSIHPYAQKLLEKYFDSSRRADVLPAAIGEWVRKSQVLAAQLEVVHPLVVNRGGARLVVHRMTQNGQTLLVLNEQAAQTRQAPRSEALLAAGLSPREAEVLSWVAQGRTNSEIGQILRLSARTVQKHLEHIFQKFGVESRTAAAARAWEVTSQI